MGKTVFQHIPKTGDCTINAILLSNVESKAVFMCGADGVLVDFMNLRQERRDAFSYLSGHVFYGIHELFSVDMELYNHLLGHSGWWGYDKVLE